MMAKQVRPWLVKPDISGALQVHETDRGANQQIPSGAVAIMPHKEARMYGCNLNLQAIMKRMLGKTGASMYGYT
jgi:hypothetical protein